MRNKPLKHGALVAVLVMSLAAPVAHGGGKQPVDVVASFSVLADMVRQVGGDFVHVTALVGRNSDPHTFSPSPAAARALATADLIVVNGLGYEGWMNRLIQASGYTGDVVVASNGVDALAAPGYAGGGHAHGEAAQQQPVHDPHAWYNVLNGVIYVHNITGALVRVDPAHAGVYRQRAHKYIDKLKALNADIKAAITALPGKQPAVVVSHNAFRYYGHAYGITFLAPVGLSTAAAASAGALAQLIRTIRANDIDALFTENITNPRLIKEVAHETGVTIGGELYSDALSKASGPASTYIDMLRYDTAQITAALGQANQQPRQ